MARAARRTIAGALAYGLIAPSVFAQAKPMQRVYRIGILLVGDATASIPFVDELAHLGLQEGINLVIESRSAQGDYGRLDALAAGLVALGCDVIVVGGGRAALAAQKATRAIPIVFTAGDPVGHRLVSSLAYPGGNLTGNALPELDPKRVELLSEVVGPRATIALLGTPPPSRLPPGYVARVAAAAGKRAEQLQAIEVNDADGFAISIEKLARERVDAVAIVSSPLALSNLKGIAAAVSKYRLPAVAEGREFVENGGLLAYSIDWDDNDRRAARYVGKILNGARPADLPVEITSRFKFIVNLKAAKALGLEVPRSMMLRADELIQ